MNLKSKLSYENIQNETNASNTNELIKLGLELVPSLLYPSKHNSLKK